MKASVLVVNMAYTWRWEHAYQFQPVNAAYRKSARRAERPYHSFSLIGVFRRPAAIIKYTFSKKRTVLVANEDSIRMLERSSQSSRIEWELQSKSGSTVGALISWHVFGRYLIVMIGWRAPIFQCCTYSWHGSKKWLANFDHTRFYAVSRQISSS